MASSLILELKGLCAGYGEIQVLWGIDLDVRRGEITALIGSNGAGKTTLMRALSGLIPTTAGYYFSEGRDLTGDDAAEILARGIVHVPEGRRLFGAMSVEENLLMGAYARRASRADIKRDLDRVYATFPKLRERRGQAAATLSGGEQQMCAIGRALMSDPKLLLLDEPSAGLAPVVVQQVFELVKRIRTSGGLTVLIVEQNVQQVLRVVDRAYLLEAGTIRASGRSDEMLANDTIREAYLGV